MIKIALKRNSRDRPREASGSKKKVFTVIVVFLCFILAVGAGSSLFKISYDIVSEDKDKNGFISSKPETYVVGVELDEKTFPKVLFVGDELDLSGIRADVTFNNDKVINMSLEDERLALRSSIDTSTPGAKLLTVSSGGITSTDVVYVADTNGVNTVSSLDDTHLYYTNLESLKLYLYGKNIIPGDYVGTERISYSNPLNYIKTINNLGNLLGGALKVNTEGDLPSSFDFTIYKGAPVIPFGENNKVRLSLGADFSSGAFLKFNLWNEYGVKKAVQITVHPGKAIDVDLSLYEDVETWEIVFCVAAGKAVNGYCYPRLDIISEITNNGEEYDPGNIGDMNINEYEVITPDSNGMFELPSDKNGVIYALNGKIYEIE